MKKILIVYLIGVFIGWYMGFNHVKNHCTKNIVTIGDIAFISIMSLTSWIDVLAFSAMEIEESGFWNKPI